MQLRRLKLEVIVLPLVLGMIIFSMFFTINASNAKINDITVAQTSLDTLRDNVADANIHLNYALLAPNEEDRQKELAFMLVTRASATKQYETLMANKSLSRDGFLPYVQKMIDERATYRDYQNRVVHASKLCGKSDNCRWKAVTEYRPLVIQYIKRVEDLQGKITERISQIKIDMLVTIAIELVLAIMCMIYILISKLHFSRDRDGY